MKNNILILIVFGLVSAGLSAQDYRDCNRNGTMEPYENPALAADERAADLLIRMNTDEKLTQLVQRNMTDFRTGNSCGTIESPFIRSAEAAKSVYDAQKYFAENTRLGIPALVIAECLHGHMAAGSTIFPQSIGLGSTWNSDMIQKMGDIISNEAYAAGVRQALSPVLDLAREPRWGRVEETYGEDPYLTTVMSSAFINGMQGSRKSWNDALQPGSVFCTLKHFTAHGTPEGGLNLGPVRGGERELRSLYMKPFEAAVKNCFPGALMPAYSSYDGIPMHANTWILTDILRNEWGYQGYIYSDYSGISMLYAFQKTQPSRKEAACAGFIAGVDLEAPNDETYRYLGELVKENRISMNQIDNSVLRVLKTKFLAGIFDNPFPDLSKLDNAFHAPESVQLSLDIARESIVLLENKMGILPVERKLRQIAVIGPNADQVQFGDYSATKRNEDGVTILQGIKKLAPQGTKVVYSEGCSITGTSKLGFLPSLDAAKKSDLVVVVMGSTSAALSGIGWGDNPLESNTCGEGFDLHKLSLEGNQLKLLKEIYKVNKNVVLILVNGRPYAMPWIKENIPGVIEAWYPGEQGGIAAAEILFGKVNPSGKLSVSFPKSEGHLPCFYNYMPSSKGYYNNPGTANKPGRDYVFSDPYSLYPFGYGLSYTSFRYSDLKLSADKPASPQTLTVTMKVTNTGSRSGKEAVQLYFRDEYSSAATPVKQLIRFSKVSLEPGQTREVSWTIPTEELAIFDSSMKKVIEPGTFNFMAGASSEDVRLNEEFEYRK